MKLKKSKLDNVEKQKKQQQLQRETKFIKVKFAWGKFFNAIGSVLMALFLLSVILSMIAIPLLVVFG